MQVARKALCPAALVAILAAGLSALMYEPGAARAQLFDPPLGWDMWDPGWTQREVWKPDRMDRSLRWRMNRHWTFMQDGVPEAYRGARNPLRATPDTIRTGHALYIENCVSCHDAAGMGHGDAGLALYPSPALLADFIRMPGAVDEYLMWAIAEGGEPFGTDMPAFDGKLTQEQIWQIITYMRAGFPQDPVTHDADEERP